MFDQEIVFEALSAIMETPVRPYSQFVEQNPGKVLPNENALSLQDFHTCSLSWHRDDGTLPLPEVSPEEAEDDSVLRRSQTEHVLDSHREGNVCG
ncbi:hypothetical protein AAFF_G00211510 [Aldrovandia affinis]|uniref:Uncharacterized protein n=1 Tax=Aldrovandia affinis TaxID=143900 RepID=A0AAD7SWT6_9TELE|nr:hypothetical protein AAFF_G00211510 [Aldrovandia affinis]